MKSKNWLITFFLVGVIGIGAFMGLNYYANPMGYFSVMKGQETYCSRDYKYQIKYSYLKEHADEYDAVVIGGSKSGALSCDVLKEYTGKTWYNLYNDKGNFTDYLASVEFLLENTNVNEIMIHISGFESRQYDLPNRANNQQLPAIASGNLFEQATEFLSYLMTDYHTTLNALKMNREKEKYNYELMDKGERDRTKSYIRFFKDPDRYVQKYVTKDQDSYLTKLFSTDNWDTRACDCHLNLTALKTIKNMCDKKGVRLDFVIGSAFMADRYMYECTEYYEWIREVAYYLGSFWDFSDYCDINMNPYNFVDDGHYNTSIGNLIIKTVFGGEQEEGYGHLLTPDNVDEYLDQRYSDFKRLKEEFETTGTIQLLDMSHPSYHPADISSIDPRLGIEAEAVGDADQDDSEETDA